MILASREKERGLSFSPLFKYVNGSRDASYDARMISAMLSAALPSKTFMSVISA